MFISLDAHEFGNKLIKLEHVAPLERIQSAASADYKHSTPPECEHERVGLEKCFAGK